MLQVNTYATTVFLTYTHIIMHYYMYTHIIYIHIHVHVHTHIIVYNTCIRDLINILHLFQVQSQRAKEKLYESVQSLLLPQMSANTIERQGSRNNTIATSSDHNTNKLTIKNKAVRRIVTKRGSEAQGMSLLMHKQWRTHFKQEFKYETKLMSQQLLMISWLYCPSWWYSRSSLIQTIYSLIWTSRQKSPFPLLIATHILALGPADVNSTALSTLPV